MSTLDELEAIRRWHENPEPFRYGYTEEGHAHVGTLLAHVDRLSAELAEERAKVNSERGSLLWWVDAADAHAEYLPEEGYLIDADHWEHIRRLATALAKDAPT